MTCFDFSSYRYCPRGWRILRADSELWLDQLSTNRVYKILSPQRGEFELFYDNLSIGVHDQFVARTDSLFNILRMVGVLMPQPSMHKQIQLTIEKFRAKK